MPIYEYACNLCGHRFDEIQKITDAPITECRSCKGEGARRLISASAFILKGGGWYADGYGLGSSGSAGGSSAPAKTSPAKPTGGGGSSGSSGSSGTSGSGSGGTSGSGNGSKDGASSAAA